MVVNPFIYSSYAVAQPIFISVAGLALFTLGTNFSDKLRHAVSI